MATFKVRVLKAAEGFVDVFDVTTKEYKIPEGGVVSNPEKFGKVLTEAMECIYARELAEAVKDASRALEKAEKRLDDGKCDVADVEKAAKRLELAEIRYSTYPSVPVCDDDFAIFVGCAITDSKLVEVDKCKKWINHLRMLEEYDAPACKRDIVAYMNDNFNLRAERRDYVKPYDVASGLNLKKVENIRKIATAETLRWNNLGIQGQKANDRKVWQQVVLTILRDAFRLEVEAKEKTNDKFYFF